MKRLIDQLHHETAELSELERIRQFSSPQFLKLIDTLVKVKGVDLYKGKGGILLTFIKVWGVILLTFIKVKGVILLTFINVKCVILLTFIKKKVVVLLK